MIKSYIDKQFADKLTKINNKFGDFPESIKNEIKDNIIKKAIENKKNTYNVKDVLKNKSNEYIQKVINKTKLNDNIKFTTVQLSSNKIDNQYINKETQKENILLNPL